MTSIAPSTANQQGPDTVGFRSSGTSPGRPVLTLHLLGPGQIGRRVLARLGELPFRLVAVSDSSATVFDRAGLDAGAIAAHKLRGGAVRDLSRAERVPTAVAVDVVAADVVVDATPSGHQDAQAAVARARAALQGGAFVALCGKNALAAAAHEWLTGDRRGQLGVNAVLGGTGRQLVAELDELRQRCDLVELVGNVTTTVIVEAVERGASVQEGIEHARALGILEPDPTLDLDGSDATTKLLAVWGAVFGDPGAPPPAHAAVAREDVRELDAALVRERARRGATTRLIARGDRAGRDLRVAFEELDRSSPLAAPADRVAYGYRIGDRLRLHTGAGIGYDLTAAALLDDLRALEVQP